MVKTISLTQGLYAKVDDEDFDWLSHWKWLAMVDKNRGVAYAARSVRTEEGKLRPLLMHRLILNVGEGEEVDHQNGNPLDNRRENLRVVSRADNLRNRRTFKNNKSGYKGVTYNPKSKKWKVIVNIGTFDTAEEAALAYDSAIKQIFGDLARGNFPK